jgi:hypothetical protein
MVVPFHPALCSALFKLQLLGLESIQAIIPHTEHWGTHLFLSIHLISPLLGSRQCFTGTVVQGEMLKIVVNMPPTK